MSANEMAKCYSFEAMTAEELEQNFVPFNPVHVKCFFMIFDYFFNNICVFGDIYFFGDMFIYCVGGWVLVIFVTFLLIDWLVDMYCIAYSTSPYLTYNGIIALAK